MLVVPSNSFSYALSLTIIYCTLTLCQVLLSLLGHKKIKSNKFFVTVDFEFRLKRQLINTEIEAQDKKIKAINCIEGII